MSDDDGTPPAGGDTDDGAAAGLAIREPPLVVVPVRVLEGDTLSEALVSFLAPARVVVVGYHVLPEQTPAEQASMQFEERARAAVDDIAAAFADAGGHPDTRVVFTHDRDVTIERVAAEVGATATLLPNPTGTVSEVLVPVRGAIDGDRLADLVGTLVADGPARVTLWGLSPEGSSFDAAAAVADAADRLRQRGVAAARIATETATSDAPIRDIVARSVDADVVVMGEGDDSLFGVLFGDDAERVAEGSVAPVLVVRKRDADAGSAGADADGGV